MVWNMSRHWHYIQDDGESTMVANLSRHRYSIADVEMKTEPGQGNRTYNKPPARHLERRRRDNQAQHLRHQIHLYRLLLFLMIL